MSHRHIPRQQHDQGMPHPLTPSTNAVSPPGPSAAAAPAPPPPNGVVPPTNVINKLNAANEQTWLLIGRVAEQMGDLEHALSAYENALRHNPTSVSGLTQVAGIARIKENYPKAVDFFQRVLQIEEDNGEIWSALGHCYLMQDDLQKAYSAYQQALYLLPNPKEDPKLWYGIGILYDRYGSLDHAEEAFASVLRMCKDFDKENEILFRLGIIYKQQGKFDESLNCFDRILRNPPSPLAHADIWFQIGHVYEQQKNHLRARDAYERVVEANPQHAKVLQQLGWLYHQDGSSFQNQDIAIQYLTKSLEADPSDAQSWYLLGRAYMAGQKYNKAYEAYQQAVYRDGRNPTFWCSIGVLYFQINQFRDALDAYSRAIRINPYISEVWFDLGSLYESCNNQITDAIDAYARAAELDPGNMAIAQRLQLLKNAQATGGQLPAAPGPQDVHPTAYASSVVPPPNLNGPPLMLQPNNHRPQFRSDSRGPPPNEVGLPPSAVNASNQSSPPAPFRGGPPPPVILDESRHVPSHTPLAPMDVDRPPHHNPREYPISREPTRGPVGLLLQHPLPPPGPSDDPRNGAHPHHPDSYYGRNPPGPRPPSRSVSPRARSPGIPYPSYPPSRPPVGPAQPSVAPHQRSPRPYHREMHAEPDVPPNWERRPPPPPHSDPREWERDSHEQRRREYPSHPVGPGHQQQQQGGPPPYNSYPRSPRGHSPPAPSPRHQPRYWEGKPSSNSGPPPPPPQPQHFRSSPPPHNHPHSHPPLPALEPSRRYDPRQDAREAREYDDRAGYPHSPEGMRARNGVHHASASVGQSNSRPVSPQIDKNRRRKEREDMQQQQHHVPPQGPPQLIPPHFQPPPPQMSTMEAPKKERRKRPNGKRKEDSSLESHKGFSTERAPSVSSGFKHGYSKGPGSPENSSSSSRSIQPSPTSATPKPVLRSVDEDYDEGADMLIHLRNSSNPDGPSHSPTISSHSRHNLTSPRMPPSHRNSISSTHGHTSPPLQIAPLKRALSPGPDESSDNSKRSRMGVDHVSSKRRISSPSGGKRTPVSSTRPSPTPFIRQQPQSEASREQQTPFTASPPLPVVLPPHPKPIGSYGQSLGGSASVQLALPPIATLSPPSSAPSPTNHSDDKMHVDRTSLSPHQRGGKLVDVIRGSSSRSPSSIKQLHSQSRSPPSEKKESSS